jgi:hypothetical protein
MLGKDPVYIPSNLGPEWGEKDAAAREALLDREANREMELREAREAREARDARDKRDSQGSIRITPA